MTIKTTKKVSPFKAKLAKLKENWEAAAAEGEKMDVFNDVPDGDYFARLVGQEFGDSNSGNFQLTTTWVIIKGEQAGSQVRRRDGLDREEGLPYVYRFLKSIGVENAEDPETLVNLEEVMAAIVEGKPAARIRLKTKNDFQNVYINKLVDMDPSEDATEPAADPSDPTPDPEPAEGDPVSFVFEKKKIKGKIVSIEGGTFTVQPDNKKMEALEMEASDFELLAKAGN